MCLHYAMVEDTPRIFRAEKALAAPQEWVASNNGHLQLVHALDENGITREGLVLRVIAYRDFPQESVTVQLEYPQLGRRDHAIDRIDWRPLNTHCNGNKGPAEFRLVEIIGTHRHSFDLNWLPDESRLRRTNLPIAVPLNPEPENFQSLLEFVGEHFRINGLSAVEPPPWEESLFTRRP